MDISSSTDRNAPAVPSSSARSVHYYTEPLTPDEAGVLEDISRGEASIGIDHCSKGALGTLRRPH
jgi:hypothetical protein